MTRVTRTLLAWVSLLLIAPTLTSCNENTIVGTYSATTFTYAPAGSTPQNVLAAGGSISLVIADDHTTSGTMVMPASIQGGGTYSLLGKAGQVGDTVRLNLVSDILLRDIDFAFDGSSLSGSKTFSGTAVVVVLSK